MRLRAAAEPSPVTTVHRAQYPMSLRAATADGRLAPTAARRYTHTHRQSYYNTTGAPNAFVSFAAMASGSKSSGSAAWMPMVVPSRAFSTTCVCAVARPLTYASAQGRRSWSLQDLMLRCGLESDR